GKIFTHLEQAARTDDRKAESIRNTLRKILIDLANVMTPRDVGSWPEDHPLVISLRRAGHTAGMDLAQALSVERDTARRATLAALLARIGEGALDAILPLLSHRNPELARAILPALVQMRSASAMTALRTLVRHPDARLRKEAVVALGPAPGTDAQLTLLAFVFDRDPQVVESCVRHLRVETARAATMQLIAALSARTLAAHPFLKRAMDDLVQVVDLLLRDRETVTFQIYSDTFFLDNQMLPEESLRNTALLASCLERTVGMFSLQRGITAAEIHAFVGVLTATVAAVRAAGGAEGMLRAAGVRRIMVGPPKDSLPADMPVKVEPASAYDAGHMVAQELHAQAGRRQSLDINKARVFLSAAIEVVLENRWALLGLMTGKNYDESSSY